VLQQCFQKYSLEWICGHVYELAKAFPKNCKKEKLKPPRCSLVGCVGAIVDLSIHLNKKNCNLKKGGD
jgi:hypothetical protein